MSTAPQTGAQTSEAAALALRGILTMVASMAFLAMSDVFIKLAGRSMPVGQMLSLIGLAGTVLFAVWARATGATLFTRLAAHPVMIWRNLLEVVGAFGMVMGVVLVPLSSYAAVIQSAPLIVTVGAAVILRERVGPRRWVAVGIGLFGMLLIVRPGTEGFMPATLFAVLGITALSLRDVITRLLPPGIPTVTVSAWGFAATVPSGPLIMALMGTPPHIGTAGLGWAAAATVVLVLGYYGVTTAMRIAPAAVVAPFRYTRLLFTMGLGIALFGDRPDGWTLAGAAIILGAGLYTFMRERQLARRAAPRG